MTTAPLESPAPVTSTEDRPLEIPRPVTSWVFYDSDRDPRLKTPVTEAASPRLGHRPAAAAPSRGAAAAAGPTRRPSGRWCSRHGVAGMGRGCAFCEPDTAVLLDDGGIEVGDQFRAGMAVHEVVSQPDGRLALEGPLNRCADGGLL